MYYSYYMLPDGTYCLAPPPPGIDVATYYSALPAGVTVSSAPGVATVPPPPGTTPPPPPDASDSSTGLTPTTTSTRYRWHIGLLVWRGLAPALQYEIFSKAFIIGDSSGASARVSTVWLWWPHCGLWYCTWLLLLGYYEVFAWWKIKLF